jgi:hypothetical protein
VTYRGSTLVAVGDDGKIATSTNGLTWTQVTSGFGTTRIYGVLTSPSQLVAFGAAGKIATSLTGATWTPQASSFGSSDIRGMSFGGNGVYAAAGSDGKIATSFDGVGWVQRTSSFGASSVNSIVMSSTRSVAVGDSGKIAISI